MLGNVANTAFPSFYFIPKYILRIEISRLYILKSTTIYVIITIRVTAHYTLSEVKNVQD